jgi:hypothetical protein
VVEHLPNKYKALISNPVKEMKERKEGRKEDRQAGRHGVTLSMLP